MSCSDELHEILIESGDIVCPFCEVQLTNEKPLRNDCCDFPDIINDDAKVVCRICGVVQGYEIALEYVDFYEKRNQIKRHSVYHRKYHIENTLTQIECENNITISVEQKNKIMRIFLEIGKIIPQINGNRKRMVSLYFILKKIFKMIGLPYKEIKTSKSKKTLAFNNQYWANIITQNRKHHSIILPL